MVFLKSFELTLKNISFISKVMFQPSYRVNTILVTIFTILQSITPLLNIELTRRLLNYLQVRTDIDKVFYLFGIMVLLQIAQRLITIMNNFFNQMLCLKLENHISELIMERVSTINYVQLFTPQTLEKLYFLRTQSTSKFSTIFQSFLSIFSSFITFGSMFIYLLYWSPLYAFLSTIVSIPIGLVQYYFNKRNFLLTKRLNRPRREQFYLMFITTTQEYIKEIAEHMSMDFLIKTHFTLFKMIYQPTKSLAIKQRLANIITSFVGIFTICYMEYQTILLGLRGKILLGTLTSILQTLGQVSGGIQKLILSFGGFHSDWLYIDYLREFMGVKSANELIQKDFNLTKPITISAKNLAYNIDGKSIFKNVSFNFVPGSVVGIIGENGCGKSTLLEIILGINKQTAGELFFNDIPSLSFTDKDRARMCQMLFQKPSQYEFTVGENIGISDVDNYNELNEDVYNFVKKIDPNSFLFNLKIQKEGRIGEWYNESRRLSGGQWQRISIYRLFYKKASIYLLDEPTNNMDKKSIAILEKIIKSVQKSAIIIVVSHDMDFLTKTCTEMYKITSEGLETLKLQFAFS